MEGFLRTLQATEICMICQEAFSKTHAPAVLPCKHVFGKQCVEDWLRNGRGNTDSCPYCRNTLFERTDEAIWLDICALPSARLHRLMTLLVENYRICRQLHRGHHSHQPFFDEILCPALSNMPPPLGDDALTRCLARLLELHGPDGSEYPMHTFQGLVKPLYRLLALTYLAHKKVPQHLITNPTFSALVFKANACLDYTTSKHNWNHLNEASSLLNDRYIHFLHLFTVFVSQDISYNGNKSPKISEMRRHEKVNFVVDAYCKGVDINRYWEGQPSNEFKDRLVSVYEELRRHQIDMGRISLRGNDGEETTVRGLWQTAAWKIKREMTR